MGEIFKMNNKIIKLLKIASKLESRGLVNCSKQLDTCAESLHLIKQAQYDGVQGYWIRNTRCWQNCYRQKRASNPDRPVQVIWNECHTEYIDSLYGNNESKWGKYADGVSDGSIKISSSDQTRLIDIEFDRLVDGFLSEGNSMEEAIAGSIIKQCSSYSDLVSEVTYSIIKVAESIQDSDLSSSIALVDVGEALTKEAQGFFRNLLDTLRGGVAYGKDAFSDSRVRGTLSRLSNIAVAKLQNVHDSILTFNATLKSTLEAARQASASGSARLSRAGEQTASLLSSVGELEYDVSPFLETLRSLPYSKFRGEAAPAEEPAPAEESAPSEPISEEELSETTEEVSTPEAASGDPGEFISNNFDVARNVASKLVQDMGQSEQGQRSLQEMVAGLGLRLASSYPVFNLLNKEAQFEDTSEKESYQRKIDELRARRRAIESRKGKGEEMTLDMMSGLAKRNPYRFLTEIMNVMGKPQFVSFLNEAISSDTGTGSGGKFRKKIKGTFEDIGGSLDL